MLHPPLVEEVLKFVGGLNRAIVRFYFLWDTQGGKCEEEVPGDIFGLLSHVCANANTAPENVSIDMYIFLPAESWVMINVGLPQLTGIIGCLEQRCLRCPFDVLEDSFGEVLCLVLGSFKITFSTQLLRC